MSLYFHKTEIICNASPLIKHATCRRHIQLSGKCTFASLSSFENETSSFCLFLIIKSVNIFLEILICLRQKVANNHDSLMKRSRGENSTGVEII